MGTFKELESWPKRKVLGLWSGTYVPHAQPLPFEDAERGGRKEGREGEKAEKAI